MRIQITAKDISIELNAKDIRKISRKYSLKEHIRFSFHDDDTFQVSLKMDNIEKVCLMYEENELIIFLPFIEFEKWLNSETSTYEFSTEQNPSNNLHFILKKEVNVPRMKSFGIPGQYSISNSISEMKINYN